MDDLCKMLKYWRQFFQDFANTIKHRISLQKEKELRLITARVNIKLQQHGPCNSAEAAD